MERMAAEYPPSRKIRASNGSVLHDGFLGVLRTGGNEATGRREERRHHLLIDGNEKNYENPHCLLWSARSQRPAPANMPAMEDCLSEKLAPNLPTMKRKSYPCTIRSLRQRYASLVILFSLLRLTAPRHPLATTTAILLAAVPFIRNRSFNPPASALRAVLNRLLMSLPLRSLSCLVRLLLIGCGELDPSLCPSSLQHEPTALGLHPRAKTEFPRSLGFAGLICPLHRKILLTILCLQGLFLQLCPSEYRNYAAWCQCLCRAAVRAT